MGYRSNVGLCFTKTAADLFNKSVKELTSLSLIGAIDDIVLSATFYKSEEATAYVWPSIKWYSSEPDIGFIMSFLGNLESEEYFLIIITEEDIETFGGYTDNPFCMSILRTIEIDAPSVSSTNKRLY